MLLDRRRAPDAQPAAALRGRSRVQSRERAQPAGARTSRSADPPDRSALQFSRDVLERVKAEAVGARTRRWRRRRRWRDRSRSSANSGSTAPTPTPSAAGPRTVTRIVSGAYFETIGTPLKAGRTFQPTDTATSPPVVILSESMARYYFKTGDPIGRRISWKLTNGITGAVSWTPPAEIVGVAADSRADGIDQAPMHTMYQPDTQAFAPSTLLVRTAGAPDRLAPRVDRDDPRSSIRTGRSITCRRSRRSATRRSRRSGSTPR